MIDFEKISIRNFLSYGDTPTEIDLKMAKTVLITGANGSGKSVLLDAITFALFGKAYRKINKGQMINAINEKNGVVEIQFSIGKSRYRIVRTLSPDGMYIYKNDNLIPQDASVKEYQRTLENTILKVNYKTFCQVVVLGSSTYQHFMDLSAQQRRSIVEDLLDISMFSEMNRLAKEDQSGLRDRNDRLLESIRVDDELISTHEETIVRMKNISDNIVDDNNAKIKILSERNRVVSDSIMESVRELDELQEAHKRLTDEYTSAFKEKSNKHIQTTRERDAAGVYIQYLARNSKCTTCKQDIDEDFKEQQLAIHSDEYKSHERTLREITDFISETLAPIKLQIDNLVEEMDNIKKKIDDESYEIKTNISKVQDLQDSNDKITSSNKDLEDAKADLQKAVDRKQHHEDMLAEVSTDLEENTVILSLLKDSGIKSHVINQYVPVINRMVNYYLDLMDFFVLFDLDKDFNESMRSRHRDVFTYSSFSEGEKQKINLALLFTWREIARMKNSVSTNLLFLDETADSNIDSDGVEIILRMLESLDNDTNTFIISHRIGDTHKDSFPCRMQVSRTGLFSELSFDRT